MSEWIASWHWGSILQIIAIDLLLSGDNAIAIALACRNLPPRQRAQGILWGTIGAIGLRILMALGALALLEIPSLKILGGVMLLWVGVKLIQAAPKAQGHVNAADQLSSAIKIILVADLVMSFDNVIGIAGAAQVAASHEHRLALIAFGLLFSIPLIICASQFLLKLLDRFPLIAPAGAGLLGWIAGGLIVSDVLIKQLYPMLSTPSSSYIAKSMGVILVIALGWSIKRKRR
jgi:YjbE family integral membrane protein